MKRLGEQSLYEILEIPRDASRDDVEKAYQRAKALYGPGSIATYSLMAPEEADLLGRRIEEARSVLGDSDLRADYDARLGPGGSAREPRPAAPAALPPIIPPARAPPPAPTGGTVAAPAPPAAPETAAAPEAAAAPAPVAAAPPPPPPAAPRAPAPAPPFVHPEGAPWTGEVLRRVRESRGVTLQQISERTKVTRHHLENIEADRYERLPAPVYLRGILMSIAKELRLDGQKVARSYLEQVAAATTPAAPVPKPR